MKVKKDKLLIYLLFFLSLSFFLIHSFFLSNRENPLSTTENFIYLKKAKDFMVSALNVIEVEKERKGIKINPENDPNMTGLIGSNYTMLTTTMGHLDAKRTSVNPDTAALICSLFINEGLNPGDTVAIGSSASFPGLLLATLSACKSLHLNPLTIVSFGASQYGANEIDFTITDILQILENNFGSLFTPLAISFGGNNDIADDLSEQARDFILKSIQKTNYHLLYEEDFSKNVQKRLLLYNKKAETEIKMFVNIGGSISNIGNSPEILNLKPGINKKLDHIPPKGKRGVLFEFAALDIPIMHLLYIKGLSIRYGLAWDPIPFEKDTYGNYLLSSKSEKERYLFFFFLFFSILVCLILIRKVIFKL